MNVNVNVNENVSIRKINQNKKLKVIDFHTRHDFSDPKT